MIKYIVEYKTGVHTIYRKLWWGGRREVGTAEDGGIISMRHIVERDLLDNDVVYDFINQNPGQEHHSKKDCKFQ